MASVVLRSFFKFVSSILIWIFFGFTFVPFFLIISTARFLISKLVPLLFEGTTAILTTTSAVAATPEDKDKFPVVICFELEGVVELKDVRSTFESRVIQKKRADGQLQWPELQQFIVQKLGYPFWKWDKSFNIQKHIRMLQVDPNFGGNGLSLQDVLDVIEESVVHKPFLPQQSPWEILIVPNFKNMPNYGSGVDEKCIGSLLVFHFDHALGDGTAISKVFENFFDGGKTTLNTLNRKTSSFSSIWDKFKFYFFGLYEVAAVGNEVLKFHWNPNTQKMKYNTAVTPTIPAEIIKNIQKVNNTAFSSVLLTLIGNALVKFMKEAGYEVPEKVPFSLPRLMEGHPLTKLTNHIIPSRAVFPTGGGHEQLGIIHRILTASNQSRALGTSFWIGKVMGTLGTNLLQPLSKSLTPDGEIILTNIQMFKDKLRFQGANKLRSTFCCGVTRGGNGIILTSYGCNEGIRLLFQIDEGIVPKNQLHAQVFIKYFLQELESISESTPQNSVSVS